MKDIVTNVCIWKVIYPREGRVGIVPINTQKIKKRGLSNYTNTVLYCSLYNKSE